MPSPLAGTLRHLEADGARRLGIQVGVGLALLGAWFAWAVLARVAVFAPAERARIEVTREVHAVQSPSAGLVIRSELQRVGRVVEAGEVLAVLDSEPERLKLAEERHRGEAASAQFAATHSELAAEERADRERRAASAAGIAEAHARSSEAAEEEKLARDELTRTQPLLSGGLVSPAEIARLKSRADRQRSATEALRGRTRKLEHDEEVEVARAQARLAALRREAARLKGLVAASRAAADSLEAEIARRTIRAPVSGTLDRATPLPAGAVVREGQTLATLVPAGALRVVAEFAPQIALGRVQPGQPARLRLDGFSWTQYGSLPATVTVVGSEAQAGRIRVELSLSPVSRSSIPLQHGLTGALEVQTEETSPLVLLLRAAGAVFEGRQ